MEISPFVGAQLPTLCDPMDGSPPRSSFHGILQARILEWLDKEAWKTRNQNCINLELTSWDEHKWVSKRNMGIYSTLWSICLPPSPWMKQTPKKSHQLNKHCLILLTAHYFSNLLNGKCMNFMEIFLKRISGVILGSSCYIKWKQAWCSRITRDFCHILAIVIVLLGLLCSFVYTL